MNKTSNNAQIVDNIEDFRKTELGEQIERFHDLMQWHGHRRSHPKEKPEIMGLRLFEILDQYDMMTEFFRHSR